MLINANAELIAKRINRTVSLVASASCSGCGIADPGLWRRKNESLQRPSPTGGRRHEKQHKRINSYFPLMIKKVLPELSTTLIWIFIILYEIMIMRSSKSMVTMECEIHSLLTFRAVDRPSVKNFAERAADMPYTRTEERIKNTNHSALLEWTKSIRLAQWSI